ncbi:amino acid ABC transporter permease [Mesorhizobium sp.]|uniref:amino acid ABC transporter permease n=1 Tax=Mesorhizobium sp. TaxID=1871066 RepID=UPI0025C36DB5|nr:amino acid ABC transporter permease [Mesorhizobium sp.]
MNTTADYLPYLSQGIVLSLALGTASFIAATLIGLLLALIRDGASALVKALISIYISVFRALPELLTILLAYYGSIAFTRSVGMPELSPFAAALLAFGVQIGSYACQIFSDAYRAVPRGLLEAAHSVGMPDYLVNIRVAIPLMLRLAAPSLGSLLLVVIKLTAIASAIGVTELTRRAQIVSGATHDPLTAFGYAAAIYLAMSAVLTLVQRRLEIAKEL